MRQESPRIPPSVAWQFALAAFANAANLARAATLLADAGLFGPARSLAISAQEEGGKFFRLLFRALELPERKGAKRLQDHKAKQALGLLLASLHRVVDVEGPSLHISWDESKGVDDARFLEGLSGLADQMQLIESEIPSLQEAVDRALAGEDEAARRAGLYVDAIWADGDWSLRTPSSVTEEQARAAIAQSTGFSAFASLLESRITLDPRVEAMAPPDIEWLRQALSKVVAPIWNAD